MLRIHYKDQENNTKMKHNELPEGFYKTLKWLCNKFEKMKHQTEFHTLFNISISDVDHKSGLASGRIAYCPSVQNYNALLGFKLVTFPPDFITAIT